MRKKYFEIEEWKDTNDVRSITNMLNPLYFLKEIKICIF